MSVENDTSFKRTGSFRVAMNRFRSSMRKKFSYTSVRITKTEKNVQAQKYKNQMDSLQLPITNEDNQTYNYKSSARDVARRFVNISRHKAQETYVAAKLVLKLKKSDTSNVTSDEESEVGNDFFEKFCLSFSDDEDISPTIENEQLISVNENSN